MKIHMAPVLISEWFMEKGERDGEVSRAPVCRRLACLR